jgi:hypothetical protein
MGAFQEMQKQPKVRSNPKIGIQNEIKLGA